jgi:hypothetical protein
MSLDQGAVLQIVPHLPGSYDGVGDYALNLAKALSKACNLQTTFLVAQTTETRSKDGFEVFSGLAGDLSSRSFDHVILHYANYGYQSRGVPFELRRFSRGLRRNLHGRWITTFHELYASGPPWKSAFWLRPWQVKIARDLIDISDFCFVSNDVIRNAISRHDARKRIRLLPVMSNFGEPELADFDGRPKARWAICGGETLIARSLRSLKAALPSIPLNYFPTEIAIIGGHQGESIRELVQDLKAAMPDTSLNCHPKITADGASQILAGCSFGWLDYYGRGKAWPGMIFKSGSFAAYCAHGVIPVLSHEESTLALEGDELPGPYFIAGGKVKLPEFEHLSQKRRQIYDWYHKHASSERAADAYLEALR